MRESLQTLIFAATLGLVCSLALVGASRVTESYRIANEQAEERSNLLAALEVPVPAGADAKMLNDIFSRTVRTDRQVNGIKLFDFVPEDSVDGRPEAVAIRFSGAGLWGHIQAVIALENDLATIRGIRFYKHEETPGLGGEISSDAFQNQFVGKRLMSASGEAGFRVTRPGAADNIPNAVDGISGATMTSDRVQDMLDALARQLAKETPEA